MLVSIAARGLFLGAASGGYFLPLHELLIAVTFLFVEHRLCARGLRWLQHKGSIVVVTELSCPMACAIFLDQGSNVCSVH